MNKWIVGFLVFCAFFLAGCTKKCSRYGVVKRVGQCSYTKINNIGYSDCVALTEKGIKVHGSEPYVPGEQVCEE